MAQTVPCAYKTGKTLGTGTYASVKEAVHIETGKHFAVKIRNEIQVLKKVSQGHPNIVTLWDYFETANNLYLVTDLCLGGELFDRICAKQYFREHDAAKLVETTVSAVAYLHEQGIVHRDLKPENLLFRSKDEDSELLIADFGLSKIIDDSTYSALNTTCGTPGYMAPEIFKKQGHGKPVDMWAIGVITYFLLCGETSLIDIGQQQVIYLLMSRLFTNTIPGYTPFDRDNQNEEIQAICTANFSFEPEEYWSEVSESARDFIRQCLTIDKSKRLSAQQALNHEWLRSVRQEPNPPTDQRGVDLLPSLKKTFDARSTFRRAIFTVRAGVILDQSNQARHHKDQATLTPQQAQFVANVAQGMKDAEHEADNLQEVYAPQ
ncbi:Calcium/calmodulin-dependent protein kinase type I [Microbotryomycetes sp. JL221]|nr:Calcium/calmodulin-dependent protein kinase type I [Microbotryomycetes sp. JL221]